MTLSIEIQDVAVGICRYQGLCATVKHLLYSSLLSKHLKFEIYRTMILPVILYGCGTWSLTLREESRLKVSENRVLRRIFGPKGDEVTGEWEKLHNVELNVCTADLIFF